MNILLLGSTGLLGTNILLLKKKNYKFICTYNKKKLKVKKNLSYKFNVKNLKIIKKKFKIDVIINCSGLTNVDECEKKKHKANIVHIKLIEKISKIFDTKKVKFVQISTDHLFDGSKKYYSESSKTNPLNFYGLSKLNSEKIVIKKFLKYLIIRGNFFGWGTKSRKSFSDWLLNNLKKKNKFTLFDDIFFNPLNLEIFIHIIFDLIQKRKSGIYNLSSNKFLSKYSFGLLIADQFNLDKNNLQKGSIDNFKLVKRPKNMSLSNSKIIKELNYPKRKLDIKSQIILLKKQINLRNKLKKL